MSKCELIPAAGLHSNVDRTLFHNDVTFKPSGEFELLGGPIGSQDFCNSHTQDRVVKATKLLSALGELPDPQVALLLLRHCASFGKLVFIRLREDGSEIQISARKQELEPDSF